jgi:hypothetical protein
MPVAHARKVTSCGREEAWSLLLDYLGLGKWGYCGLPGFMISRDQATPGGRDVVLSGTFSSGGGQVTGRVTKWSEYDYLQLSIYKGLFI